MKSIRILLVCFSIAWVVACNDEPVVVPDCDHDIGTYTLLQSSFDHIPYFDKSEVTFKDSLGNFTTLTIRELALFKGGGTYFKYNVNTPGDTVRYCYRADYQNFNLFNDEMEIFFNLALKSVPYHPDPLSLTVADILDIFSKDPNNTTTSKGVFYTTVDQRTYPQKLGSPEFHSSLTFFGREFLNVENSTYSNPFNELYYNTTEGIVAFTDHSGKLWRFDSME